MNILRQQKEHDVIRKLSEFKLTDILNSSLKYVPLFYKVGYFSEEFCARRPYCYTATRKLRTMI